MVDDMGRGYLVKDRLGKDRLIGQRIDALVEEHPQPLELTFYERERTVEPVADGCELTISTVFEMTPLGPAINPEEFSSSDQKGILRRSCLYGCMRTGVNVWVKLPKRAASRLEYVVDDIPRGEKMRSLTNRAKSIPEYVAMI